MSQHRVPRGAASGSGGQFAATHRPEAEVELFFHVAPASARESIEQHGLDHAKGESAYADTSLNYPTGNYLFTDPQAAADYATAREQEELDEYGPEAEDYDLYEVTLPPDARVEPDPFRDDESGLGASAVYAPDPIPADHVRASQ